MHGCYTAHCQAEILDLKNDSDILLYKNGLKKTTSAEKLNWSLDKMKKQLALAGGIESEMEENEYLWSSQKCYYTASWEKASVQTVSNLFLKKIIEEAPTTETGSLFKFLTTLSSGDGT